MHIYEIRSNGAIINLTEGLNIYLQDFVDLDNDGIWEIEGVQLIFIPEGAHFGYCYTRCDVPRWLKWNGSAYEPLPLFEDK